MAEPINTPRPSRTCRDWDEWLAGPMFFLALMFLVALAGLIHRYPRIGPDSAEAYVIVSGLGILWLRLLLETLYRYRHRDREHGSWKTLLATVAFALIPPLRMGRHSRVRPNHIWLPVLGWREVNKR